MLFNDLSNLLFEQENDFLGIYDLQRFHFLRINQSGIRLMGFSSNQKFSDFRDPWFRATHDEDTEITTKIAKLLESEHHYEEVEVKCLSGQVFRGGITITLIRGTSTALVRIVNLNRLYEAEFALLQSIRQYETIVSNATIGIIVCNENGQIISANKMAEKLFSYSEVEFTTMDIEQLIPADRIDVHRQHRKNFNVNPQTREMGNGYDLRAVNKEGVDFPVEVSLSYFRLNDELYAIAFINNIVFKKEAKLQLKAQHELINQLNVELEQKVANRTHALINTLRQLEKSKEELAKALERERELGALKSRFVSLASHEFRTPLTAILTSTTLVEKYVDGAQQDKIHKHLGRIRASVNHLNEILEEFLSLGRLEEGKVEIHTNRVNLAQLVEEILEVMQGILKPGQTIQTFFSSADVIIIDVTLLRNIILNLLTNAVKYSDAESSITVEGTCKDGLLTLIVQDSGIGISEEDQKHLFERFFRAKNAANISGTGLGLHIVNQYVNLLGGHITLASVLNQGTTVTITLPYENNFID
ncbi:sensor histidine kinase [Runella aurantiaca]|uniref:histidine kinase n=1 Tax=Runella aurantiaca TaxID=2282308 RepID=A0A369HYD5_9BACT|nr:PAS domain-containing sensor histidine kinase [Runella aurantiaca]RDB02539.1 PAS domain-containing sensor histidine kinase [Runella aurantiaca]